jgi:O-antigen ligase
VRYGIAGFVLLAAGYVWGLWRVMMRAALEGDPVLARIRRAWVFTFLGLSFTLTTVHVWTSIYSFVFFLFGAGMWLMTATAAQDQTPNQTPGPSPDQPGPTRPGPAYSRFAPRVRRHAGP